MATDKLVDFDHVTDYISREAALACFSDWIDRYGHEHTADEMVEFQRIEELPAADVRPVKIGHYVTDEMGDSSCSECGEKYLDITKRFCPECGAELRRSADMREATP